MSSKHGISVSKPISAWNKSLKVKFKDFFKSLTKATAQASTGSIAGAGKEAMEALSAISLGTDCNGVAWLLIQRSLTQAIYTLVEENEELLFRDPANPRVVRYQLGDLADDPESLSSQLDLSLEKKKLVIDEKFFKSPRDLSFIEDFKTPFSQWLQAFGLTEAQASSITDRLPSYFVFALNDQWRNRPEEYVCLKEAFDTPFTKAGEKEQGWSRYSAWLQMQVDEGMFDEAFSLRQVYVPLRAYYEQRKENGKQKKLERSIAEEKKTEKIVIDLEKNLEAWLSKGTALDAIRVISGGPGSGKSSFAKMFAARQAGKSDRRVLFIPLHLFEPSDDLVDAVGNFVRDDHFLPHNPLDPENGDSRLLIIFDGLDELAMQGRVAAEIAQQFVLEVQRKAERFNNQGEPRLKVLISGRELVVQANASEFRKPQQILHVLPYFVPEDERGNFTDTKELLKQDQRQQWWISYGQASGKNYAGVPAELDREQLLEITSQPLLNYLVALSYDRGQLDLAQESNLNSIYEDLLKAVYQRGWAHNPHPATKDVKEDQFIRILEEIAVAAWHGDGRTTSVREIESHCESSGLKGLLDALQEGASKGVTRLLMAFYFRRAGHRQSGDQTFEFTHKSFGEYLTARRIVSVVKQLHDELERRRKNFDRGFDERFALEHWIRLCGPVATDDYLFDFIRNEMLLQEQSEIALWHEAICQMINYLLRNGTPMEKLDPRLPFQEECRQARNAEEALLAVRSICADLTETMSKIDWPTLTSFGEWIARLQGQRGGSKNVLALKCLSHLDLRASTLYMRDFYGANFYKSNLERSELTYANCSLANFMGANLQSARMDTAHLRVADFSGALLDGSDLTRASLENADLTDASFKGAVLNGTTIRGAYIRSTDNKFTRLRGTKREIDHLTGKTRPRKNRASSKKSKKAR
ncbi:MAG: pentapeptide repeat-containing protein [Pyrinomonadaceae bacterium]